ncbi:MAG: hypothetical protein WC455_15995 [Dehalococcoidia bacterium]
MKAWFAAAWIKVRAAVGWVVAGIALIVSAMLLLHDKAKTCSKVDTSKIDEEGRHAHDAEAARVAALPADAVVDSLPNAGEIRDAANPPIAAGKGRIHDLLDRYRMAADGGRDRLRAGDDGKTGGG